MLENYDRIQSLRGCIFFCLFLSPGEACGTGGTERQDTPALEGLNNKNLCCSESANGFENCCVPENKWMKPLPILLFKVF
jgi:hypothetical protein